MKSILGSIRNRETLDSLILSSQIGMELFSSQLNASE